jgi:DNA-binding protein H-NS
MAGASRKFDFDRMTIDELWHLHEQVSQVLSIRLTTEKKALEKRLSRLRSENLSTATKAVESPRRKYPRVFPKYHNPSEPGQTWSGRGKQPRWLAAALKTGHKIEEFLISK